MTGNECLAIYRIYGKKYYVYGCWDSDTEEGEFDFYDLHDEDDHCLNLGEPMDEIPTYEEVKEIVDFLNTP